MRILTTYEYSEISYTSIFEDARSLESIEKIKGLENLFIDKYKGMVNFKLSSISFKNFVGIIKVDDLLIEVLPKIYSAGSDNEATIEKNDIYKNLNYMINKSSKLSIRNIDIANYGNSEDSIFLDFFINMFLQELYTNLFKGTYKTYVSREENLRYIKGRLLVAENIRKNFIPNKIYCKFDEFTEDNLVNQVLKYTTKLMSKITNWRQNQILADNIIHAFNDVSDMHITSETFSYIREDRLLGEYSKLLGIAKMFIDGQSFDINSDNQLNNFIFNIDMNIVYQEYIFELLNEYKSEIFGNNLTIRSQYSKEHLIYDNSNKGRFLLKPDIVILDNNNVKIIIDTKYKKLNASGHRNGVSDKDLYQMFGYYHKYNQPLIFLLYPKYQNDISNQYRFEKHKEPVVFINTISLENKLYTPQGEHELVESLKRLFENKVTDSLAW